MPTAIQKANLPISPFDGQIFIDFRGIRWMFSAKDSCWRNAGVASDIPNATVEQTGLLSPTMKRLVDTLPERAGGFGILTRPLLSVVPLHRKPIYKGTVRSAQENASGSQIKIDASVLTVNSFAGKLIFFSSGVLKSKYYVVFTNGDDMIYAMGKEAANAKRGDKFEILEATALNEHGVIQGDIELVSETLEISCVNGKGDPIVTPDGCPANKVFVDDPENPPGLDIKVSKKYLDQFCVTIPGCAGVVGDRGPQGKRGKDGTGDGPKGDRGEAGIDAPEVGHTFSGIKINDIDDVYDTAVVALEMDGNTGKLHVVKAKIKVPDDSRPAERVIATAVSRDLRFTDTDFAYDLMMPGSDPINVEDVEIMHYPQGFAPPTVDGQRSNRYEPNVIKLSAFINALVVHYQDKLEAAGVKYDTDIKPFVEGKDSEARKILAELADDVAKCEWDMPIEFCLGISPENCKPIERTAQPFPLAEALLGPEYEGAVAIPLPEISVPVTPNDPDVPGDDIPPSTPTVPSTPSVPGTPTIHDTTIQYPGRPLYPEDSTTFDLNDRPARRARSQVITPGENQPAQVLDADGHSTIRPSAIVLVYSGGAGRTDSSTWTAAVTAEYFDETGNSGSVQIKDADAAVLHDFDESAFIAAQSSASELETAVAIELEAAGEVHLSLILEGTRGQGRVMVQPYQVFNRSNMSNLPADITQVMARAPSGEMGTVFTGEVDCPECPDCNAEVDCGDVDCPECPPDVSITAISPASGSPAGGYSITIIGTGFGSTTGAVTIGGTPASVVGWSNTTITVNVPPHIAGDVDVVVTTDDGETDVAPNGFEFELIAEINAINPNTIVGVAGGVVNITGTGFGTSGTITIGGVPVLPGWIVGWSDTTITINIPPGALGSGDHTVIVTNNFGDSDTAPNGLLVT